MAGYYRSHIPNMAKHALHLTALLKKDTVFHFGNKQKNAFHSIKHLLMHNTLLSHPNWDLPWRIQTDASDYCVSACLVQRHALPIGTTFTKEEAATQNVVKMGDTWFEEKPIAFASKTLNKTQRNWTVREKEAWSPSFGVCVTNSQNMSAAPTSM